MKKTQMRKWVIAGAAALLVLGSTTIAYAKENNFYNVTLNVWSLNESAMRFYEACGLVPQKVGMEKIL